MKKLLAIVLLAALAFGQEGFVGDTFERGSVDYGNRMIRATGIGFVPQNVINAGQARRAALRIAKTDALRQMVEIVNGVVLTSETTMSGAMLDDVVKMQVEGMIRGAYQVGEPKYLSDTSIEVVYEVPMSGISEIVIPPVTYAAPPPGAAGATPATGIPTPTSGSITGLIIDARGLGIRPAMSPTILDQNGSIIYGPGNYSREYAVTNGVAGYSKDLTAAMADTRVAGNPLVVKGVAASGTNKTDVSVANSDVMKIKSADTRSGVLRDCRVLILLD